MSATPSNISAMPPTTAEGPRGRLAAGGWSFGLCGVTIFLTYCATGLRASPFLGALARSAFCISRAFPWAPE